MLDFSDKGYLKDKSWRELSEAASREHDPERLLELITALNDLLEQKEEEEKANRTPRQGARGTLPTSYREHRRRVTHACTFRRFPILPVAKAEEWASGFWAVIPG